MPIRFSLREWLMTILIILLLAVVIREEYRSLKGPSEQDVIDQFHKLFYDSKAWKTTTWLGVPAQQNPNDAWIHQEIITKVKPDFIVETGTLYGGSAVLWAMILQHVNPKGRVITIDIKDQASAAKDLPIVKDRVDLLVGSSVDPAIVEEVIERVSGKRVLVILDSNHSKSHVLAEMKAYAPIVSKESYLIVQDTNVNVNPVLGDFGPGPMEAVNEFLAANDQFRPDRDAERLKFTMHPKEYLKRIR